MLYYRESPQLSQIRVRSFISCQCYSLMPYSTVRSSFVLVPNFRLCVISLCDFQMFPISDSHTGAHPHYELHLILVIILACTLFYLFAKISLTILLLIAIFQLLQVSLAIFTRVVRFFKKNRFT